MLLKEHLNSIIFLLISTRKLKLRFLLLKVEQSNLNKKLMCFVRKEILFYFKINKYTDLI